MRADLIYVFINIWAVSFVFISWWMLKAKPCKNVVNKYPRKIVFLSQMPFGKRWIKFVDSEDLHLMEKYQYRIKLWYLALIIPFHLFFAYLYLMF
jgi:hypothetical protein